MATEIKIDLVADLAIAEIERFNKTISKTEKIVDSANYQFNTFGKETAKSINKASSEFNFFNEQIKQVGLTLLGVFSARLVVDFFKSATQEAVNFENALIGVKSVAQSFGVETNKVEEAIKAYTSDGLIPANEAATAFKQILSTGADLQTAIKLLNSLKNAAAFNRQEFYTLGQAVVATTEGIKNGNSVKADAVGVTTNLSVLEARYAASIGKTVGQLNDAEKIQARVNGFINEGALFVGDASRLLDTYSGKVSQLNAAYIQLQIAIGKSVTGSVALNQVFSIAINLLDELKISAASGGGVFDTIIKGALRVADISYRTINAIVESIKALMISMRALVLGVFTLIEKGFNALGFNLTIFTDKFKQNAIDFKKSTDSILSSFTQSNVFSSAINKINKDINKVKDDSISKEKQEALLQSQKQRALIDQLQSQKNANKERKSGLSILNQELELFKKIQGEFKAGFSDPLTGLIGATETISGLRAQIVKGIASPEVAKALGEAVRNAFIGGVAGIAGNVLQGAAGAKTLLTSGVKAGANAIIPGLGEAVGPIAEAFFSGPEAVKGLVESFMQAIPSLIEGFIEAAIVFVETLIENIPQLIQSLISKIPNIIRAIIEGLPRILTELALLMPQVAISFTTALISEAPRIAEALIKSVLNIPGKVGGGIKRALGFAEGGQAFVKQVPNGYNNDSFPARLTSGELVVDRGTASKLKSFLNNSDEMLMALMTQPILVQVDGRTIAKAVRNQTKAGFIL